MSLRSVTFLCGVCVALAAVLSTADAGQPQLRISRGTTFHYIDYPRQYQVEWRHIKGNLGFLPPGKFFLAFDKHPDVNRTLIRTEDGIWGYIPGDPVYWIDELHFLQMRRNARLYNRQLGVVKLPFLAGNLVFRVGDGPFQVEPPVNSDDMTTLFICHDDELSDKFDAISRGPIPRPYGGLCFDFGVDSGNIEVLRPDEIGIRVDAAYLGGVIVTNKEKLFPSLVHDEVFSHQKRCGNSAPITISETSLTEFSVKLQAALKGFGIEFGYKEQVSTQVTHQFQYQADNHVDEKMYFFADTQSTILFDTARWHCDNELDHRRAFAVMGDMEITFEEILRFAAQIGLRTTGQQNPLSTKVSLDDYRDYYKLWEASPVGDFNERVRSWVLSRIYEIHKWEDFIKRNPS